MERSKRERRSPAVMLACLLLLVQALGPVLPSSAPAPRAGPRASGDWPQFHSDAARTGSTSSPAPGVNTTVWTFRAEGAFNASPIVVGGTAYAGCADGNLYAFNSSTGQVLWKSSTGGPVLGSPAVAGNFLYAGSDDGGLHILHLSNGTQSFNFSTWSPVRAPVLAAGSAVVFGNEAGTLAALDLSGALLWAVSLTAPARGMASAGGSVFVSHGGTLSALELSTGKWLWNASAGPGNLSGPCTERGRVLAGSEDGFLAAFDAGDGAELWRTPVGGAVAATPALQNGSVFVGTTAGELHRLNSTLGGAEWAAPLSVGSEVRSSPAVSGDVLVFGTGAGLSSAFTNASEHWRLPSGPVPSSPALSGGRAFAGTADGTLLAVGRRPTAVILSDLPALSPQTAPLTFNGTSPDCTPVAQEWRSSLDGLLSRAGNFTLSMLSLGVHEVSYRVQDSDFSWSAPDTAVVEVIPPDQWPMFRKDTSRRGVSRGESPQTKTLVWSTTLPGRIASSPAVCEGFVFVGTRLSGGLHALDRDNGSLRWYYSDTYGAIDSTPACADGMVFVGDDAGNIIAFDADPSDDMDEGPVKDVQGKERDVIWTTRVGSVQGSPLVVSGKVLVPSKGDARLYAFDEWTGIQLWNFSLADPDNSSIWSSPACEGGLVVFGANDQKLHALDLETGREAWNFSARGEIRSTPCIFNGTVYFGSSDFKLYAIDLLNGTKNWEYATGDEVISSPVVSNGKVLFGSYDTYFRALNAELGNLIWVCQTGGPIYTSAAVGGGLVFFGAHDGLVYALNETNGRVVWTHDTGVPLLLSSPALVNGRLYIGTDRGEVLAFGKAPDLQVLPQDIALSPPDPSVGETVKVTAQVRNVGTLEASARVRLSDGDPGATVGIVDIMIPPGGAVGMEGNWTVGPGIHSVVVNITDTSPYEANRANNRAFKLYTPPPQAGWTMLKGGADRTSSRPNLTAPNDAELAWTLELRSETFSSPVTAGSRVYQAAGNEVVALDAGNGTVLWRFDAGAPVRSTPAVANVVVFGCSDGLVRALNEWDGSPAWMSPFATGGPVSSSPLLVSEMTYVGSDDGYLYALSPAGGQVWRTFLGGPVQSSPAFDPETELLVVGSQLLDGRGRLTCLFLNGTEAWNLTLPAPVLSTPAISRGRVYAGCDDGTVSCLELRPDATDDGTEDPTGSRHDLLWAANLSTLVPGDDTRVRSSPALGGESLFVGAGKNSLFALSASSGAVLWQRELGEPASERHLMSSPAVADCRIYVGAGGLFALNAFTGEPVWSYTPGDWTWSSPALSADSASPFRGAVLAATEGGRLLCFATVVKIPPNARVASPADGQVLRVDENALFDAAGSSDPDGYIAGYNWSFGDGRFGSGAALLHNYTAPGEYLVNLTVKDDKGLEGRASVTIFVRENSAPSLRFPLVDPNETGDVLTPFMLKVSYYDQDNDTPAFVRARAGDQVLDLEPLLPSDNDYTDGREYLCETVLLSGIFGVWFEASDGVLTNRTPVVANLTVTNRSVFSYAGVIHVEMLYAGRGEVRFNSSILSHEPPPGLVRASDDLKEFDISTHNMDRMWWANITVNFTGLNLARVNRSTLRIYRWDTTDPSNASWRLGENDGLDLWRNLTYINITGLSTFAVLAKRIPNNPPVARLSGRTLTILQGETASFNASGSFDADNDTLAYFWDFGDGPDRTLRPGDRKAEHRYTKAGRFTVTLVVNDTHTNSTPVTLTVTVKQKGGEQTVFIIVVIIVLVLGIVFFLPRGQKAPIEEIPQPPPAQKKPTAKKVWAKDEEE